MRFVTLVTFETLLIVAAVAVPAYLRLSSAAWDILLTEKGAVKILLIGNHQGRRDAQRGLTVNLPTTQFEDGKAWACMTQLA
jgi:hypothetical protein